MSNKETLSGPERAAHFTATLVECRRLGIALPPAYVEAIAELHGVPLPTVEGDDTPEGRAAAAARAKARRAEGAASARGAEEALQLERAAKEKEDLDARRRAASRVHMCEVFGISIHSSDREIVEGFFQARELAAFQLSATPDMRVAIDAVAVANGLDPEDCRRRARQLLGLHVPAEWSDFERHGAQ